MKRVNVTARQDGREFTYQAYRLSGTINGRRIRQQFNDRLEAQAALNRLQVQVFNLDHMHAVMTRLAAACVVEAAIGRLAGTGKPLSFVVDWFLANYREPRTSLPVSALKDAFLADRASRGIEEVTLRDYRQSITRFAVAMGAKALPDISPEDVEKYLRATSATRPKS